MGRNAPSKTSIDHDASVRDADRSAPILNWIKKDIQELTNVAAENLHGGITVDLSKSILRPIKDKRWTKDREKGSAYVIFIQRLLNERLDANLILDSQLGPATNAALRQFQQKVRSEIGEPYTARVIVDGIIGPATINALLSDDDNFTELKAYFNNKTDDAARADAATPSRAAATTDTAPAPAPAPAPARARDANTDRQGFERALENFSRGV